jgi:hypothetical protein
MGKAGQSIDPFSYLYPLTYKFDIDLKLTMTKKDNET